MSMQRKLLKRLGFSALAALAPVMVGCAAPPRQVGPPIPAPLSMREATDIAQRQAGGGRLEHIDDLGNGHLYGVTDAGRSGPFNQSSLLFVHNDGTLAQWPGR